MKYYHLIISVFAAVMLLGCNGIDKPIMKSDTYAWFHNRIEQGDYTAVALSDTVIVSDYQSHTTEALPRLLEFKFSINGKDNEMIAGKNHKMLCTSAMCETPVIEFGSQLDMSGTDKDNEPMDINTELTIKVDLSAVFQAFDSIGYYVTPTGSKVYKEDFKGVWVAGGVAPLQWDFDNLMGKRHLMLADEDGDHIYSVRLTFNKPIEHVDNQWTLKNDISEYPKYEAPTILEKAIYNMSVDEMVNAVEPDSTLRTGAEWAGVWTRDVSYSIILSMAYMQPQVSKNSLLRKVNSRMRIIQDTGTGGAWPCSTDRMIWTVAAWEIYLVTGDREWLEFIYPVICNSIEDDRLVAYNAEYGLMTGESSFIDWRDQSYPKWMQPVDIYQSMCLGTNAVHYRSLSIAAHIATLLNDTATASKYAEWAEDLKQNINKHFYMDDKQYYAAYLYGRNSYQQEQRSESLGEALTLLWDIAPLDLQQTISKNIPFTEYGAPIFYPYIKEMPAYHNNAVWPFVSSYCGMAYAKALNMTGVLHSFATIYRAAALFCTNKENFEAVTGDHKLTQVNSSNMLWSLSGNIALVHKILFGLQFTEEGLRFAPVVPSQMQGCRHLDNFKYRNALLDIEVSGHGSEIKSFTIDGVECEPIVPEDLEGEHDIKIVMSPSKNEIAKINMVKNAFATCEVQNIRLENNALRWQANPAVKEYIVYCNGEAIGKANNQKNDEEHTFAIDTAMKGEIQLRGYSKQTGLSFASEPQRVYRQVYLYELEQYATVSTFQSSGYNGAGFVKLDNKSAQAIQFDVEVSEQGRYAIDVRYANGNGPTNTDNRCAIRSIYLDDKYHGSIVMPQRGTNEWSNWGWTNAVFVDLTPGKHTVKIDYQRHNFNMNINVNTALADQLRLTRLN